MIAPDQMDLLYRWKTPRPSVLWRKPTERRKTSTDPRFAVNRKSYVRLV